MRLFLLPISTRRTLLYCQKLQKLPTPKQTYLEKGQIRAAKLWADWEKKDAGWQRKVVDGGNHLLRRIPYQEWGLKSVPPLSTRRREEEILGKEKHHLIFPESVIPANKAADVLRQLGTEREAYHRSRLIWCFVGMPVSAPFALVPIIPNLPFFYLVYRAWSHWRALAGGRHLQWLVTKGFLTLAPSKSLDTLYETILAARSSKGPTTDPKSGLATPDHANSSGEDQMLLSQESGRQVVRALDLPELEVEIERAIWQVEHAIHKEKEERSKSHGAGTQESASKGPEKQ
ncbi:mitochondrial K+-H+ exchange-related-domain-containing protein [Xylariomycetidae sp. FL0641]|nr:mitochondrial K+-H+ exchange-related-domain-containing protein [Xylariomycetidae sp. FL0641]